MSRKSNSGPVRLRPVREGNRPAPADGQGLRPSYEATGRWGKASELRSILQLAHVTLDCGYAIETGSGGESAYIPEASKRAVLVDSENAE